MIKSGLVIAALVFSAAGFACDETVVRADQDMNAYRDRAMAQLRAENLDALRQSLRRSQVELSSDTRERYLAEQPGSSGGATSRGAP